jgi:hypothetical protein
MKFNGHSSESSKECVQNGHINRTRDRIAAQLKVGNGTIARAAEFVLAIDKIVATTGINCNDILSGKIDGM